MLSPNRYGPELNGHKSNVKALIPVGPNIYNLFLGQVIEQMDTIFRQNGVGKLWRSDMTLVV